MDENCSESKSDVMRSFFNEYIEQQNAWLHPGAKKIQLESVLIRNDWYDQLINT